MKKLKCNVGEYGVIINSDKEFLILQLPISEAFTKESWMLPGGRLDEGDEPEIGLKREISEETDLKVNIVSPVHTAIWGSANPVKYAVFYLCKTVGESKVKLSHEHTAFKWIKFSEIDKIHWHNQNSKIAIQKSKNILSKCS